MKIAIIGAGISGLTCAHELERLGVKFDIFDKKYKSGEAMSYITTSLRVMNTSIKNPIKFINESFNIRLSPLNEVSQITMKSQNKTAVIKGNLGTTFLRGQDDSSTESQLFNLIKAEVKYDSYIEIDDIKDSYDKIIVATGDSKIAQKFGVWKQYFPPFGTRLVRVVGKFNPFEIKMWLNTEYAKSGFVYLIPFNSSAAFYGLIAPESDKDGIDALWNNFIDGENISEQIVESYNMEFPVGLSEPLNVGNIYFTGNAGGFIEPFLGCGQVIAMWSGVLAARSIVNNLDYNSESQKIIQKVKTMAVYRRSINKFNDKDFDRLISILGLPIIKNIIYNSSLSIIKYGAYFLKG